MSRFMQDVHVTWCAMTGTTERATRRRGARAFLPALFVDRFANMGGLDKNVFAAQLDGCRTFEDEGWVTYWRDLAQVHLDAADLELASLGVPGVARLLDTDGTDDAVVTELGVALARAVHVLADRTPENGATLLADVVAEQPQHRAAAVAIDELVKAMTYPFAASWPGWTPRRLQAYRDSQRLLHVLLLGLAPHTGFAAEQVVLDVEGEDVVAYAAFPEGDHECATILVTNGLEGTIQEVLLPALRLRDRGLALVVMEMPGTFQYRRPLSVASEQVYAAVIEQIAAHPRVDAGRMGMMGLSFGAHW